MTEIIYIKDNGIKIFITKKRDTIIFKNTILDETFGFLDAIKYTCSFIFIDCLITDIFSDAFEEEIKYLPKRFTFKNCVFYDNISTI